MEFHTHVHISSHDSERSAVRLEIGIWGIRIPKEMRVNNLPQKDGWLMKTGYHFLAGIRVSHALRISVDGNYLSDNEH